MATLDLQVGASTDDVHESAGTVTDSATTVLVYASSGLQYWGGLRWVNAALSLGDTIDVAYFSINNWTAANDDVDVALHFELGASPLTFTTGASSDVSGRSRTVANSAWVATALGLGWVNSPSVVGALQEVANGYDITAMVGIFKPNAPASAAILQFRPYNYDTTLAAKLHIEYTAGGGAAFVPVLMVI